MKKKIYVFVDALGWKQAEKYGFLRDLLPNRRAIQMQFGYSCTAIPTILSGVTPAVHGHLAFYDYAPSSSPFRKMRYLAPFLRPRGFWRRGRVRAQLSKLVKRLYGFTGYFQLYGVPIERLPSLDYCEKRDLFAKGGLAPVANLGTRRACAGTYPTGGFRRSRTSRSRATCSPKAPSTAPSCIRRRSTRSSTTR